MSSVGVRVILHVRVRGQLLIVLQTEQDQFNSDDERSYHLYLDGPFLRMEGKGRPQYNLTL